MTNKQAEVLKYLRDNYHRLPTRTSPEGTCFLTGCHTTILARLLDLGYIEGQVYLRGVVLNLKIKRQDA